MKHLSLKVLLHSKGKKSSILYQRSSSANYILHSKSYALSENDQYFSTEESWT